jgi:1,4-alpha-glucan branching enzyme
MGEPDMWIKTVKEYPDDKWDMWRIWGELTSRRPGEKYIGYVESHDQALVGDKTMMFRLCDSKMYTDMSKNSTDLVVERGIALHKMMRLITMTAGGEGYLNFMGNEFGHPEWIDFPREGNGWSYFYCRRQWHLADDPTLRYGGLVEFDRAMIKQFGKKRFFSAKPKALFIDQGAQVLVCERAGYLFAFNFSPDNSYESYWLTASKEGRYKVVLSSDEKKFGGKDRISKTYIYTAEPDANGTPKLRIYLPARTALCLRKIKDK